MSRSLLRRLLPLAALCAALLLAACGGGDESEEGGGGSPATSGDGSVTDKLFAGSAADNRENPEEGGKKGGKLTVLSSGDVDYMDPGKTYYSYAWGIMNTLHRGLFAYLPDDTSKPVPDLAAGDAEIAEDGKTVTVKIKEGVMFSEPVKRAVTSKDVKYAIERAFTANVSNGYARAYLGDLIGAPEKPGPYKAIEGIETPDDQTIVFKLSKSTGAMVAGALAMPISVPVPKEFAEKYDKKTTSTYGEEYAVFTGPYKVESDAQGKQTGYVAGKRISIVRNPDYADVDDFRPAFLDAIDIRGGNEDNSVSTRRILSGESMASGELEPPANQLKRLLESNKTELSAVPGGGWSIISMDTSRPPFDDLNVRKAVIAGFDRNAVRQQKGGEALGPIAQGLIPPGMAGFEESGGIDGYSKEFDWLAKPEGDRKLSAEYFKKAGSTTGKYAGDEELLLVAESTEPQKSIAQITEQQLNEMGFKTKLRLVTRDTMYTKFCNVPKSEVNVCPSLGWLKDFPDAVTMLDPTFNGANILETQNSNWPELDVPEVNDAIDKAKLVSEAGPRAQAWAEANKLIMAQAPVIPYMFDYATVVASPNVRGVQNGYSTTWDWNFTSLR